VTRGGNFTVPPRCGKERTMTHTLVGTDIRRYYATLGVPRRDWLMDHHGEGRRIRQHPHTLTQHAAA
jgi:hypothetical protein